MAVKVLDRNGTELKAGDRVQCKGWSGKPEVERIGSPNRVDQLPVHMAARNGTTTTRWVVWGDASRPAGTYYVADLELIDPSTEEAK